MSVDSSSSILPTVNVLSVCTGMYGLDLGFDIAAERCLGRLVRTVCGVEREAYCAEVLATRMEEECLAPFPVWSNLKTFDGRPWRGLVDWVVGGYPCQPFSQAGKRLGTDDPRHLWPDIARIIRELGGPRTEGSLDGLDGCFFENVRGHLTLGLDVVVGELRGLGFEVAAGLFSAEEVGASHRRERVFILAIRPGLLADGERSESRGGERGIEEEGGVWRDRPSDVGEELADDSTSGRGELRQPSRGDGLAQRCVEVVADDDEGLEGRRISVGQRGDELPAGTSGSKMVGLFAPGPTAFDRWGEVLLRFRPDLAPALPDPSDDLLQECQAKAQSELRRVVDGLAPRMERLRGLGNGVVPLEAAHAFSYLFDQHRTGGPLVYRD